MLMMSTSPATVASEDGTTIAYWMTGQGPPLVLVQGTVSNHNTWDPVATLPEWSGSGVRTIPDPGRRVRAWSAALA